MTSPKPLQLNFSSKNAIRKCATTYSMPNVDKNY